MLSPSKLETHAGKWLFCFLLGCTALCFSGHGSSVDENLVVQVVDSFVHKGELTVAQMFQSLPGGDGKHYSRYGFGYPLLLLPFFLVGKTLSFVVPQSPAYCGNVFMFVMLWSSVLCTAFLGWLFYQLCLLLDGKPVYAALLALCLIIGTTFLPYSQTLYRLTASGTLLLWVLYLVLRYKKWKKKIDLLWIFLLTALGLNLREDLVIGLFWIGVYCLFLPNTHQRIWTANAVFWGAVFGLILWGGHNVLRFGSLYINNYSDVHLDYPLIVSAPQLLFGAKRGIITYSPLCLLLLFSVRHCYIQQKTRVWLLCFFIFTSYLLLYGKSDFWHGGVCYGPRHMYFVLPFAILPGIWFWDKWRSWKTPMIAGMFIIGMVMNLPGVYAHPGRYQSFFEAPPFLSLLFKPVESLDYAGFEDLDLWWMRMMKIEFFSIWTVMFMMVLLLTVYSGYCLYQCLRDE